MEQIAKTVEEMLMEDDSTVEETKPESIFEPDDEVAETTPVEETKPEEPKIEEKVEEPATDTISSEESVESTPDVVEQPKKLYAGKYERPEDLEKAYTELQSAFTKKSQAVSEKVKETETLIDDREFENKIAAEVETKALDAITKTYVSITDPEIRKKAAECLMGYNTTGDTRYMELYYNCLEPSVDRQLQKQLTQISLETRQSYASRRNEIMYEPVKKELLEMESEDPEFLKENADILVQVIKSNPKTSIREIRDLIKQVEERAIDKYKKISITAPKVEKSPIVPAQKAQPPKAEDKPKKPEYAMSVKEMLLSE